MGKKKKKENTHPGLIHPMNIFISKLNSRKFTRKCSKKSNSIDKKDNKLIPNQMKLKENHKSIILPFA